MGVTLTKTLTLTLFKWKLSELTAESTESANGVLGCGEEVHSAGLRDIARRYCEIKTKDVIKLYEIHIGGDSYCQ